MMDFDVVVAADLANGIGLGGAIPWRLPGDLARFRAITTAHSAPTAAAQNAVIMGRKTWDSLPARFRPLPGRLNVVVSRNAALAVPTDVVLATDFDRALGEVSDGQARHAVDQCFIAGGAEIYRAALAHGGCRRIHLTRVEGTFGCDVFLAEFDRTHVLVERSPVQEEGGLRYWFERWERSP